MQKIFDQYGGVITAVIAVVALIGVIGLLFTPGGQGWMDQAFNRVVGDFSGKANSAIDNFKPWDDGDETTNGLAVTVNPDGSASGVVPPSENETPETPVEIPEEKLPRVIEFTGGTFESVTNYTAGTYETVEYEVSHTAVKYPALYSSIVWSQWQITSDDDGNILNVEPKDITLDVIDEQYSDYIVYDFGTEKHLKYEGVAGDSVMLYYFHNDSDDTEANAVYLAAYIQKAENRNGLHMAKWDGTKYVAIDVDAEIAAIDTFTYTHTTTQSKTIQVTAPSSSTEYVYVPMGTFEAAEDMTWGEWLASDYNTIGLTEEDVTIRDGETFGEVALTAVIEAEKTYSFYDVKSNGAEYTITIEGVADGEYNGVYGTIKSGETVILEILEQMWPTTFTATNADISITGGQSFFFYDYCIHISNPTGDVTITASTDKPTID